MALEAAAGLRPELQLFGTDYDTPDGTCVRDYVHVTDLADAHVLAVEGLLAGRPGGPYNLGTGTGRSNREILTGIEPVVGLPVPYREAPAAPATPGSRRRRLPLPPRLRLDPRHSDLDTIVRTAWDWLSAWRGL